MYYTYVRGSYYQNFVLRYKKWRWYICLSIIIIIIVLLVHIASHSMTRCNYIRYFVTAYTWHKLRHHSACDFCDDTISPKEMCLKFELIFLDKHAKPWFSTFHHNFIDFSDEWNIFYNTYDFRKIFRLNNAGNHVVFKSPKPWTERKNHALCITSVFRVIKASSRQI